MTAATPYPLAWPAGRPRTLSRRDSRFRGRDGSAIGLSDAIKRVDEELGRISAKYPVISTNVQPRLGGGTVSGSHVSDPGVAVYFKLRDRSVCLPCDRYARVAENLAAIAAHIEGMRASERHGVATIAEMFAGFTALPAPEKPPRPWWEVLKIYAEASPAVINASYADLAKRAHPDRPGGSHEEMIELNRARTEALKDRS